jgi:hypothetical protein
MNELKVTDILGRQIQTNDLITVCTLDTRGMGFAGVYKVKIIGYTLEEYVLVLEPVSKWARPVLEVRGQFLEDKCFGYDNLIVKA